MNILQFIIAIPLFLILFFGIGFILNMLLKTTWMPLVLYVLLVIGTIIYLLVNDRIPHTTDYVMLASGLVGAFASGWTIKILRAKGYSMF